LGHRDVDERIILKWDLEKYGVKLDNEFMWGQDFFSMVIVTTN
jgi:hypothetical protein